MPNAVEDDGLADFEAWDRAQEDKRVEKFKKILREAHEKCFSASGFSFVDSCTQHLEEKKFLTDKQIEALKRVDEGFRGYWYEDRDDCGDVWGGDDFDAWGELEYFERSGDR